MNNFTVMMALMRQDEMMRQADRARLAAEARRAAARATRTARVPVIRLAVAAVRVRPTVTGR